MVLEPDSETEVQVARTEEPDVAVTTHTHDLYAVNEAAACAGYRHHHQTHGYFTPSLVQAKHGVSLCALDIHAKNVHLLTVTVVPVVM